MSRFPLTLDGGLRPSLTLFDILQKHFWPVANYFSMKDIFEKKDLVFALDTSCT